MRFCINGNPIPKKRHRTCMVGRYARTYDPQTKQKNCTRKIINDEMIKNKYEPIKEGPISVKLTSYCQIPASFSAKKRARLQGSYCAKRPDIDNYLKFLLDVCNGLVYSDDGQVAQVFTDKRYADEPSMILEIKRVDPPVSYGATISSTPSADQIHDLITRAYSYGIDHRTLGELSVSKNNEEIKINYNVT